MSFLTLLDECNKIVIDLFDSIPNILDFFVQPLASHTSIIFNVINLIPLINDITASVITDVIVAIAGQHSILYLMFGLGLPFVLVYSFVKWVFSIIP